MDPERVVQLQSAVMATSAPSGAQNKCALWIIGQGFISVHWHTFSAKGGVFYLQECRNPDTNPSLGTSSQNWASPGFSWVANKEYQQGGPQLFQASDHMYGRSSSTEMDAEENKELEEVCFWVESPDIVHIYLGLYAKTPYEMFNYALLLESVIYLM